MWQSWLSTSLPSSSSTTKMELALRQPSAATSTGLTPSRKRTAMRSSCVMPMSSVILSAGLWRWRLNSNHSLVLQLFAWLTTVQHSCCCVPPTPKIIIFHQLHTFSCSSKCLIITQKKQGGRFCHKTLGVAITYPTACWQEPMKNGLGRGTSSEPTFKKTFLTIIILL